MWLASLGGWRDVSGGADGRIGCRHWLWEEEETFGWEEEGEVGVVVTMPIKGWIGGGGCVVVVHGGFGVVVVEEAVERKERERTNNRERKKLGGY